MEALALLEVRDSKFGKGLFAATHLAANTIVCTVKGPILSFQQTIAFQECESHYLQVEQDQYILCEAPFLYSNHSCEPNCALNAQLQMFTLRDIEQDEELLWDYSTSMLERHWTMECACNTPSCRKIIQDFDLLPELLQAYYLEKSIVLPFIAHLLQSFSNAHVHRA
jgi:hypothetical protein